ncbi:MAG TPA: LytR C-terminal domain-containing protein, partial [Acidimicrobiia bacterium]
DDVIVAFANGQPLTTNIASLRRLEVLNGNGVEGSAGRMSELLEQRGFEVASVDDADRSDYQATTIIVRPDALEQARALVDAIGFGEVSTGALDDGIDAIVIVGLDADRSLRTG